MCVYQSLIFPLSVLLIMCHTRDYVNDRKLYVSFHSKHESPCDEHCREDSEDEDEECASCVRIQHEVGSSRSGVRMCFLLNETPSTDNRPCRARPVSIESGPSPQPCAVYRTLQVTCMPIKINSHYQSHLISLFGPLQATP